MLSGFVIQDSVQVLPLPDSSTVLISPEIKGNGDQSHSPLLADVL